MTLPVFVTIKISHSREQTSNWTNHQGIWISLYLKSKTTAWNRLLDSTSPRILRTTDVAIGRKLEEIHVTTCNLFKPINLSPVAKSAGLISSMTSSVFCNTWHTTIRTFLNKFSSGEFSPISLWPVNCCLHHVTWEIAFLLNKIHYHTVKTEQRTDHLNTLTSGHNRKWHFLVIKVLWQPRCKLTMAKDLQVLKPFTLYYNLRCTTQNLYSISIKTWMELYVIRHGEE